MPPSLINVAPAATLDPLGGKTIAVLGYGSQGASHALNLRDSGLRVIVGQRPRASADAATRDGFEVRSIKDAARAADLLIFGLPDELIPGIFDQQIRPHLRPGQTLGFLHGFVIVYELIEPPADVDIVLLGPKGQGKAVRSEYMAGRGVGALVAVHQDATGRARETVLAWCAGIGAHRTAIFETTFRDETETDLFGEQAVLCGGVSALVTAAFETLVAAGYSPELAYLECCHELKLVVDLLYRDGISGMRAQVSQTACFGDLTRGPRVVDEHVQSKMREILNEIRSGQFAREWVSEAHMGKVRMRAMLRRAAEHPIEQAGEAVRAALWGPTNS